MVTQLRYDVSRRTGNAEGVAVRQDGRLMHTASAPVPFPCGRAAVLHRGFFRTFLLNCPAWARKSHRSGRVAPIRTSWVPGCLWEWAYPQYGLPFRTPLRSARDWFAPASMQPGMVSVAADRDANRQPVHGCSPAANHGATTRCSAHRRDAGTKGFPSRSRQEGVRTRSGSPQKSIS